jgi:hypothetical protein
LCAGASLVAQTPGKTPAPTGRLSATQLSQLREFSRMISDGVSQEQILKRWAEFLKRESADVDLALEAIRVEAEKDLRDKLDDAKSRLELSRRMVEALQEEIRGAQEAMARSRRISWESKSFAVENGKLIVARTGIITDGRALENYISRLKSLLDENEQSNREARTQFESTDQKTNQLFNILSTVLKSMKEAAQGISRNTL